MSKVSVFDQGWIDLVFEGRNKAYGAYQMRRDDSKTTIKAFFSGVGLMALMVGIPFVVYSFKPAPDAIPADKPILVETGTIYEIEPPATIEEPKPEPAAPAAKNPNETVKFVAPVAATVTTPVDIPTTAQVNNTEIGSVTQAGTGTQINIEPTSPTGVESGTGKAPTTATSGPGTVEFKVDVMPEFPGGIDSFRRTVGEKFRLPNVDRAVQMRVYVTFVVETDGTMTNIKVGKDPGYNLAYEAERVLKSIRTKWKPGIKNGVAVRTGYSLPITVNIK